MFTYRTAPMELCLVSPSKILKMKQYLGSIRAVNPPTSNPLESPVGTEQRLRPPLVQTCLTTVLLRLWAWRRSQSSKAPRQASDLSNFGFFCTRLIRWNPSLPFFSSFRKATLLQSPVQSTRGKNLYFSRSTIPTVCRYEKCGVFRKHHTSRSGLL